MEIGFVFLESANDLNNAITDISQQVVTKPKYGLRYISFENKYPVDICNIFRNNNITPIITWELFFPSIDGDNRRKCSKEETHLTELINGKYDSYLDNFASQVKQWNDIVYIRPFHEFNANWYVWGGEKNGAENGGPDLIKQCWVYIVNKFRKHEVKNVKWIWCPHEPSAMVSLDDWNHIKNYWPGDDYVDLLGIDGFNFYPENPERENPGFYSFESLFSETYKQITPLSKKPIFIMTGTSEFSRNGDIANKADWINDIFGKIKNVYTQIKIITWFNYRYSETINWKIDSSKESLIAFNSSIG
jgi:hypothetical protein